MPVERAMRQTSSTQFVQWKEYMDQELNKPDRADMYAAQIAAEVKLLRLTVNAMFSKQKKELKVRIKDFILKFTRKKEKPQQEKKMTRDEADKMAKAFFFGLAGFKRKEN